MGWGKSFSRATLSGGGALYARRVREFASRGKEDTIILLPEIPSGDTILYKRMVFLEILAKYLEIPEILEIRISR